MSGLVQNKADEAMWEEAKKVAQESTGKSGKDFDQWPLVASIYQNMKQSATSKFDNLHQMTQAMFDLEHLVSEELKTVVAGADYSELMEKSPTDFAARYWLMQFCEPLSRKELKAVVDGFMIQLLTEEQAKSLAKFLLIRFPHYYKGDIEQPEEKLKLYDQLQISQDAKDGKKPELPEYAKPKPEPEIEEEPVADEPGTPLASEEAL